MLKQILNIFGIIYFFFAFVSSGQQGKTVSYNM